MVSRQNMATGAVMCMDAISFLRFLMLLILCRKESRFSSLICLQPLCILLASSWPMQVFLDCSTYLTKIQKKKKKSSGISYVTKSSISWFSFRESTVMFVLLCYPISHHTFLYTFKYLPYWNKKIKHTNTGHQIRLVRVANKRDNIKTRSNYGENTWPKGTVNWESRTLPSNSSFLHFWPADFRQNISSFQD